MSIDAHRHCQKTVLSANGTANGNGATWNIISQLSIPQAWITEFNSNKQNITEDFASILKILKGVDDACVKKVKVNGNTISPVNNIADIGTFPTDDNVVHKTGDETIAGNKTLTGTTTLKGGTTAVLDDSPSDTATGHEIVDAAWIKTNITSRIEKVEGAVGITKSDVVCYISPSGSDSNLEQQYTNYGNDAKQRKYPLFSINQAITFLNRFRTNAKNLHFIISCDGGKYNYNAQQQIKHTDCTPYSGCVIQIRPTDSTSSTKPEFNFNGYFKTNGNYYTYADRRCFYCYCSTQFYGIKINGGITELDNNGNQIYKSKRDYYNDFLYASAISITNSGTTIVIDQGTSIENFTRGIISDGSGTICLNLKKVSFINCGICVYWENSMGRILLDEKETELTVTNAYLVFHLRGSSLYFRWGNITNKNTKYINVTGLTAQFILANHDSVGTKPLFYQSAIWGNPWNYNDTETVNGYTVIKYYNQMLGVSINLDSSNDANSKSTASEKQNYIININNSAYAGYAENQIKLFKAYITL